MSTIIDEGSLRFIFPTNWPVIKYDETKFYRQNIIPTASNSKAVDIIAVPNPELNKILMIEVKDFRGYATENKHRIISGELVVEVIQKAMDTLSVLYLANYCKNNEFANFVTNQLTPPIKIELVLFMEEDAVTIPQGNDTRSKLRIQNKNKRIEELTISLRQKLKGTVNIRSKVLNTDRINARDGFIVKHI
ncbi:hypothetical protein SAMN05518672_102805 [Chitinophaga sp. CF118]|uniref:hypothetical protein n=1 Tax=Chitinophaga sp. CF118 TaxID=1884367 RepID=UPI0008F25730|nr:hypothetical protein [Chitinophaga sp. CF118]SFD65321.1 hypothetical protein SAMN05518672_102805 [Chitinophaga sp. CF118]